MLARRYGGAWLCAAAFAGGGCTTSPRAPTSGVTARTNTRSTLAAAIDAYLAPVVRSRDFAGAVLVARGDRVLFEKGYGMANAELDAPNTPATMFRIASITKTFTAAAIVVLVERGAVRYVDTLSKYIPDFPNGNRITIRHLLLHQSGVPNPSYEQITARLSLAQLIEQFKNKPLQFQPGTRSQYSNAGYILLAAVIEKAAGMPYAEFIRRNITEPLGLRSTVPDVQEAVLPGRATGYVPGPPPNGLENVVWYDMSSMAGSGGLLSSVRDLHRWARAVHRDALYRHTALEYPYGWGQRKYFGRDLIEQSGQLDGFTSYLGIYFADSTYVICLTNVEAGLNDRCGKDLAAIAFGQPYERPLPTATPVAPATVTMADSGRYSADGIGTFRLSVDDGRPYVRWTTARTSHYAVPVGRDSLVVRADRSVIVMERDGTGRATALGRSWGGGSPARFVRH